MGNDSEFLERAQELIKKECEQNRQFNETKQLLKTAEEDLFSVKEQKEKEKEQLLEKRRTEIERGFNTRIEKAYADISAAEKEKNKSREQQMKMRMENETRGICAETDELEKRYKDKLRFLKIPGKGRLYFSLFMPRKLSEILILIMFVLVVFLALPFGIYSIIPQRSIIALILIYFFDILIFGFIYVGISNRTRGRYPEEVKAARELLNRILANRKQIEHTKDNIKNDSDNSKYDLSGEDSKIAGLIEKKTKIEKEKERELSKFDTETSKVLVDEIEAKYKGKSETAAAEYDRLKTLFEQLKNETDKTQSEITVELYPFIDKKYLTEDALAKISGMIRNNEAGNINEAIEKLEKGE